MPPAGAAILVLDMGATKLAAGIGTPDGEVRRVATVPTHASEGAETVLTRAFGLARQVHVEALAEGESVHAIGVSTMGYTHADRVELATNVPGWTGLRIPEALDRAFPGLPAFIGNDVHVAAQAEMAWGVLCGVGDGIYLNLGSGISAGIICGGKLVAGADGVAGEVGYSLFRGRPEERMATDGIAPFEAWFGGAGAARRLAEAGLPPSVAEALEQSATNERARQFIDELWTGIAVLTANLCIALNPSVVAIGGGYVRGDSGVLERIDGLLERAVPFPPRVTRARFGADASLRGAVAIALDGLGARTGAAASPQTRAQNGSSVPPGADAPARTGAAA